MCLIHALELGHQVTAHERQQAFEVYIDQTTNEQITLGCILVSMHKPKDARSIQSKLPKPSKENTKPKSLDDLSMPTLTHH